jgi:hypothetical protein
MEEMEAVFVQVTMVGGMEGSLEVGLLLLQLQIEEN